jgi:hypothetical protein
MYHFHSLVNLVWQPRYPQYRRLVAINGRFDLCASFALDFSDSTSNPTKDMWHDDFRQLNTHFLASSSSGVSIRTFVPATQVNYEWQNLFGRIDIVRGASARGASSTLVSDHKVLFPKIAGVYKAWNLRFALVIPP